jgi:hypothetical protein
MSEGNGAYLPDVEALPCPYESGLHSPPPGIRTEFIPGTKSEQSNAQYDYGQQSFGMGA